MIENKYGISVKTNIFLFFLIITINIFQFFALPFLLVKNLAWGFVIIPLALINNMMWFLIHEAIHKNFHPNPELNDLAGRILSIFFGASYQLLLFGHMMHHKLNRNWESEYSENNPWDKTKYYFKLFVGVYFTEILGSLFLLMFNKKTIMRISAYHKPGDENFLINVDNYFYKKERINKARTEVALSVLFFGSSAILFGQYILFFFSILLLRAMMISLMDNIFHYGTPTDNSVSGRIVKANKLTSILLLNSNFHGLHHTNPKIPWRELPIQASNQELDFSETFLESLIMQFSGVKPMSLN